MLVYFSAERRDGGNGNGIVDGDDSDSAYAVVPDRTGRGPCWKRGTPLGDLTIPSPILQHVAGITGVYEYTFTVERPTTMADFREKADRYRQQQLGRRTMMKMKMMNSKSSNNNNTTATNDNDNGGTGGTGDDEYEEKETEEEKLWHSVEHLRDLERRFWKRLGPTMPPTSYGADQEGTLFADEACGWSLANLDSCLSSCAMITTTTTTKAATTTKQVAGPPSPASRHPICTPECGVAFSALTRRT